jgi:hypothetical protein
MGGSTGVGGGVSGTALAMALISTDAEFFFFRRTGAGLRFMFFAAMNAAKFKHWRLGGKQISP